MPKSRGKSLGTRLVLCALSRGAPENFEILGPQNDSGAISSQKTFWQS